MPQTASAPTPARTAPDDAERPTWRVRLAADLRRLWKQEREGWDAQVAGNAQQATDLWDSMPAVDSKTVARMAPIFEKHEGCPFDVKRIRPGGYSSIDDMIQHLVDEN